MGGREGAGVGSPGAGAGEEGWEMVADPEFPEICAGFARLENRRVSVGVRGRDRVADSESQFSRSFGDQDRFFFACLQPPMSGDMSFNVKRALSRVLGGVFHTKI